MRKVILEIHIQWSRGIRSLLLVSLLVLAVDTKVVASEPISVESMVDVRSFPWQTPVNLSPDGTWVAYTLVLPARTSIHKEKKFSMFTPTGATWQSHKAEVWIANTNTHEQMQISAPGSSSWDPVWSPDNRCIAFYSDAGGKTGLWVWDLATRKSRAIGTAHTHTLALPEVPVWSPDSRFVFTKIIGDETKPFVATSDDTSELKPIVFSSDPIQTTQPDADHDVATEIGPYANLRADLAKINVSNGRVEVLDRDKYIAHWWLSPDGHYMVFSAADGAAKHTSDFISYSLWLVNVATGERRVLASHVPIMTVGNALSWSPDGTQIAYAVLQRPEKDSPVDCYTIRVDRNELPLRLSVRERPNDLVYFTVPVWSADGSTVLLYDSHAVYVYYLPSHRERAIHLPEGRSAISLVVPHARPYLLPTKGTTIQLWATNTKTMDIELHRLDYVTGKDVVVKSEAISLGNEPRLSVDTSRDGSIIVHQRQATDSPPDLWVTDVDFNRLERVTSINPQLAGQSFGTSRLITWRTADGKDLHGALLLPPDYRPGTRVPLVVEIYGGSDLAKYMNQFGIVDAFMGVSHQLFASRGYAVLAAQTSLNVGTPVLDLLKSVLPAVDKTVEIGVALPDAVGVMGASYGGYNTLAIISQTDRFKAAVAVAPASDMMDSTTWMEDDGSAPWFSWAEDSQGRMGVNPWQSRERYIENSPLFYADRIHTPVLLAAGGTDANAVRGAREMFASLRYLHRKAEYAEYPSGAHLPDYWARDQQVDFANRMLSWFDLYLKGH